MGQEPSQDFLEKRQNKQSLSTSCCTNQGEKTYLIIKSQDGKEAYQDSRPREMVRKSPLKSNEEDEDLEFHVSDEKTLFSGSVNHL